MFFDDYIISPNTRIVKEIICESRPLIGQNTTGKTQEYEHCVTVAATAAAAAKVYMADYE